MEGTDACALCRRETRLTFHHLLPKSLRHKKRYRKKFSKAEFEKGIFVCRSCHDAVHRFISERELADSFNTLETLRAHPEVEKFVEWVAKQRPSARPRVRGGLG